MKIVKMLNQHRRDFRAVVECEGCGATAEISGYDDRNYHDNVMPQMHCKACGQSRIDTGFEVPPTATRYGEYEIV